MFGLGPMEMLIVGIIAVLLFGKRLPEVGRSFGKSIMEFKKGMRDVESDFHSATNVSSSVAHHRAELDDHDEPTAPKFEPPAREPYAPPAHDPSDQPANV